jgi:hypothetical protein
VLFISALSVTGCMPPFNWRDVRFNEQKIVATFPGKPDSMTRTIDLAGTKLPMTMHGVRVKELSYTVAWVRLPGANANATTNADSATTASILATMQLGMLKNVGAASVDGLPPKVTPVLTDTQVQLTDVSGKAISVVRAKKVVVMPTASGQKSSPPLQMNAIFASHNGYAFQVVAVGSAEQFRHSTEALESAKVFLESVRFIQ